jgi:hypothetical protein
MGHFSNSTEGECYEAHWCERCVHCPRYDENVDETADNFCAVLISHQRYCDETHYRSVLNILIPVVDGVNQKCRMFYEDEKRGLEYAGQDVLFKS